jgi:hypothetical protein
MSEPSGGRRRERFQASLVTRDHLRIKGSQAHILSARPCDSFNAIGSRGPDCSDGHGPRARPLHELAGCALGHLRITRHVDERAPRRPTEEAHPHSGSGSIERASSWPGLPWGSAPAPSFLPSDSLRILLTTSGGRPGSLVRPALNLSTSRWRADVGRHRQEMFASRTSRTSVSRPAQLRSRA